MDGDNPVNGQTQHSVHAGELDIRAHLIVNAGIVVNKDVVPDPAAVSM